MATSFIKLTDLSDAKDYSAKVHEIVGKVMEKRHEILEHFAQAYVAETGLNPSECELVERAESDSSGIRYVWFFRKRELT